MSNNELVEANKFLPPAKQELTNDLDYARRNLYDIIETGSAALQEFTQIAQQSQHPRAFEVLTGMLKTMAEINQQLIDISREKTAVEDDPEVEQQNVVQNNLILTTKDLGEMIEAMRNKKDGTN